MSDDEKMTQALDALVPKSLDDIIREHRDVAILRFATDDDTTPLLAVVTYESDAQDITSWSLITLDIRIPEAPLRATMLTGWHSTRGCAWVTSPVLQLDPSTQCMRTRSGTLYHMQGPSSDQPDVFVICSWLHTTRLGAYLGVLPVFY